MIRTPIFVVTLEQDELTLVRIDGRLDKALAAAIAAHPRDAVRQVKGEKEEPPAG